MTHQIFYFFIRSVFSLSGPNKTVHKTCTATELQLLQKGVVKSWMGPLTSAMLVTTIANRPADWTFCCAKNYRTTKT